MIMANKTFILLPQIHESVYYILIMKILISFDLNPKTDHSVHVSTYAEEAFSDILNKNVTFLFSCWEILHALLWLT